VTCAQSHQDEEPNALDAIAEQARIRQQRHEAGEAEETKAGSDRRLQRLQNMDEDVRTHMSALACGCSYARYWMVGRNVGHAYKSERIPECKM
jgi:hypothetical protein